MSSLINNFTKAVGSWATSPETKGEQDNGTISTPTDGLKVPGHFPSDLDEAENGSSIQHSARSDSTMPSPAEDIFSPSDLASPLTPLSPPSNMQGSTQRRPCVATGAATTPSPTLSRRRSLPALDSRAPLAPSRSTYGHMDRPTNNWLRRSSAFNSTFPEEAPSPTPLSTPASIPSTPEPSQHAPSHILCCPSPTKKPSSRSAKTFHVRSQSQPPSKNPFANTSSRLSPKNPSPASTFTTTTSTPFTPVLKPTTSPIAAWSNIDSAGRTPPKHHNVVDLDGDILMEEAPRTGPRATTPLTTTTAVPATSPKRAAHVSKAVSDHISRVKAAANESKHHAALMHKEATGKHEHDDQQEHNDDDNGHDTTANKTSAGINMALKGSATVLVQRLTILAIRMIRRHGITLEYVLANPDLYIPPSPHSSSFALLRQKREITTLAEKRHHELSKQLSHLQAGIERDAAVLKGERGDPFRKAVEAVEFVCREEAGYVEYLRFLARGGAGSMAHSGTHDGDGVGDGDLESVVHREVEMVYRQHRELWTRWAPRVQGLVNWLRSCKGDECKDLGRCDGEKIRLAMSEIERIADGLCVDEIVVGKERDGQYKFFFQDWVGSLGPAGHQHHHAHVDHDGDDSDAEAEAMELRGRHRSNISAAKSCDPGIMEGIMEAWEKWAEKERILGDGGKMDVNKNKKGVRFRDEVMVREFAHGEDLRSSSSEEML